MLAVVDDVYARWSLKRCEHMNLAELDTHDILRLDSANRERMRD